MVLRDSEPTIIQRVGVYTIQFDDGRELVLTEHEMDRLMANVQGAITMASEDRPEKVTVYQCPAPGCPFASGGIMEMQAHINEKHQGEWNEDDWPDPEDDRDA